MPDGLRIAEVRERLLREMSTLMGQGGLAVARSFYAQLLDQHPQLSKRITFGDPERRNARLASLVRLVSAQVNLAASLAPSVAAARVPQEPCESFDPDERKFLATLARVLTDCQTTAPAALGCAIWLNELTVVDDLFMFAVTP